VILEGIVTTLSLEGVLNIAPMGPQVEPDMKRFLLRPFQTSTTYRNLREHREGVLHVTDDVLLLARTAIGQPVEVATRPADVVRGEILLGACRYYEFRVSTLEEHDQRATLHAETVAEGRLRDFFGLNRAKHAVVEAAILATRTEFLPIREILDEFTKLDVLVKKTGGEAECSAMLVLKNYVEGIAREKGINPRMLNS
jgi:uncharacterized protein